MVAAPASQQMQTKPTFVHTAAHGILFRQSWLGVWRKYGAAPAVASGSRPDKNGVLDASRALIREIDK